MLYCKRTDVSESIVVNKTDVSKECIICDYCYFLDREYLDFNHLYVIPAMIY